MQSWKLIFLPFLAEFVEVIEKTELYSKIAFKLDGPFVQLYFGKVYSVTLKDQKKTCLILKLKIS